MLESAGNDTLAEAKEVSIQPDPKPATTSELSSPSLAEMKESTESAGAEDLPARRTGNSGEQQVPSIHTRPSRRSTIENEQGQSEKAKEVAIGRKEERGLIRRVPLYRRPVADAERWHDNVNIPSQWSPFFYGMYIYLLMHTPKETDGGR